MSLLRLRFLPFSGDSCVSSADVSAGVLAGVGVFADLVETLAGVGVLTGVGVFVDLAEILAGVNAGAGVVVALAGGGLDTGRRRSKPETIDFVRSFVVPSPEPPAFIPRGCVAAVNPPQQQLTAESFHVVVRSIPKS